MRSYIIGIVSSLIIGSFLVTSDLFSKSSEITEADNITEASNIVEIRETAEVTDVGNQEEVSYFTRTFNGVIGQDIPELQFALTAYKDGYFYFIDNIAIKDYRTGDIMQKINSLNAFATDRQTLGFTIIDINSDGYKDFWISMHTGEPNEFDVQWLYNREQNQFICNQELPISISSRQLRDGEPIFISPYNFVEFLGDINQVFLITEKWDYGRKRDTYYKFIDDELTAYGQHSSYFSIYGPCWGDYGHFHGLVETEWKFMYGTGRYR